jgi:hypothetical protein
MVSLSTAEVIGSLTLHQGVAGLALVAGTALVLALAALQVGTVSHWSGHRNPG